MTFTLPEDLAAQLLRRVPARHRSRYVSEALGAKLRERADRLLLACELANADPDILAIEREWDALPDEVKEP
jgi:Arc/MetJ family transcription regulator